MARKQDIRLRRSSTAGAIPTAGNLNLGELAINTADGALYFKKGDGTIITAGDNTIFHIDSDADNSGANKKIGIGTTSPAKTLDIDGTLNVTGATTLEGTLSFTGTAVYNALDLNNNNITDVNNISFADAGPNEGLQWTNTKIFESPNDLTTNSAGNLQFVYGTARKLTVDNLGIDVVGRIDSSGNITAGVPQNGSTATMVRAHYSDGAHSSLRGYGVTFGRNASYLRPENDGTQSLYFGLTDGTKDWDNIQLFTAGETSFIKQITADEITYPVIIQAIDRNDSVEQTTASGVGLQFKLASNSDSFIGASIAATREGSTDTNSSTGLAFHVSQNNQTLDEVLRIDQDGNVGIGTSTPSEKLQVVGKILAGGQIRSSSYLEDYPSFSFADDIDTGMFSDTADQLEFSTGGTSRMTIMDSGRVGIGTNTAYTTGGNAQLSINSSSTNVGLTIGNSNNDLIYFRRIDTGKYQLQTYDSGNDGNIQLNPYGGKVGVGLNGDDPVEEFEVGDNIRAARFIADGAGFLLRKHVDSWNAGSQSHDVVYNGWRAALNDYTYLKSAGNSTSGHGIIVAADNGTYLGQTDLENGQLADDADNPIGNTWAYFKNAESYIKGDLGVGTTSPNRQIHISDSGATVALKVEATDGNQASVDLKNSEGEFRIISDGGALSIYDQGDTAERFKIDTSGNVLVGKSSSDSATDGIELRASNQLLATANNTTPLNIRRNGSSGAFIGFNLNGTSWGSISPGSTALSITTTQNDITFTNASDSLHFGGGAFRPFSADSGAVDLGSSSAKFKDLYLTGSVYSSGNLVADNVSKRVATTAQGSNGAENGANTWAKLATYSMSTDQSHTDASFTYSINAEESSQADAGMFHLRVRWGDQSGTAAPIVNIDWVSLSEGGLLNNSSFKMISDGSVNSDIELWVKKVANYGGFHLWELAYNKESVVDVSYESDSAWQSAEPTATGSSAVNYRSSALKFDGKEIIIGDNYNNATTILTTGQIRSGSLTGQSVMLNPNGSIELCRTDSSADPFIDFKNANADDFDARIQLISGHSLRLYTGGNGSTTAGITVDQNQTTTLHGTANIGGELNLTNSSSTNILDYYNSLFQIRSYDGTNYKTSIDMVRDGATKLRYNNVIHLETASHGISIVGPDGAAGTNSALHIIDPTAANYGGHFTFADTLNRIEIGGIEDGTKNVALSIDRDETRVQVHGELRGPNSFTINPANNGGTYGDTNGTVIIQGDLQVDGTTTTINSTTLDVDDLNITLASGAANKAAADGAGITIDCGSDTNATITYDASNDRFNFDREIHTSNGIRIEQASPYLILKDTSDDDDHSIRFTANNNDNVAWIDTSTDDLRLRTFGSRGIILLTGDVKRLDVHDNGNVRFYENSGTNVRMKWDATNEFLGIGGSDRLTLDPSIIIDPSNGTSKTYALIKQNVGSENLAFAMNGDDTTDRMSFFTDYGSSGTYDERLTIVAQTGYIGINEDAPAGPLEINGGTGVATSGTLIVRQKGNTGNDGIAITSNNATSHRIWKDSNGTLNIGPSTNLTAFVQKLDGKVGIGTNAPERQLHVEADGQLVVAKFESGNNAGALIDIENDATLASNAGAYAGLRFYNDSGFEMALTHITESSGNGYVQIGTAWASGGEKLVVHSNGKVGIGTTSPDALLDLEGNFEGNDNFALKFTNTKGNGTVGGFRSHGLNGEHLTIYQNGARKQSWAGSEITFFGASDAEIVAFKNTGRVGIGTNSPDGELDVRGTAVSTILARSTSANSQARVMVQNDAQAWSTKVHTDDDFYIKDETADTVRFAIDTSGNVGVGTGTNAIARKFVVRDSGAQMSLLSDTDGSSVINFGDTADDNAGRIHYNNDTDAMFIRTATVDRIAILSNGNVGIGNTNPGTDERLRVQDSRNGDVKLLLSNAYDDDDAASTPTATLALSATSTNAHLRVHGSTTDVASEHKIDLGSTASGSFITFSPGNSEKVRVTTDGKVGIGTNNPVQKLQVDGSIYSNGGEFFVNNGKGVSAVGDLVFKTNNGSAYQTTMHLDGADDKVGIGTTTPAEKLHVSGNIKGTGTVSTGAFILPNASGTSGQVLSWPSSGTTLEWTDAAGGTAGVVQDADGDTKIQVEESTDEDKIRFDTAGSQRMIITHEGKVGIGTASPSTALTIHKATAVMPNSTTASLHLNDSSTLAANTGGSIVFTGVYTGTTSLTAGPYIKAYKMNSTDGDYGFGLKLAVRENNSTQKVALTIKDTQEIGIGTETPARKLEVDFTGSTYGARFTRSDAAGNSLIEFANNGGVKSVIGFDSGNSGFIVSTGSTPQVVVKSSTGNVGIGTTTAGSKLVINGTSGEGWDRNLALAMDGTVIAKIVGDADGTKFRNMAAGDYHWFRNSGNNTTAVITDGGLLGVSKAAPAFRIHTSSAMAASPSGVIYMEMSGTNTNGGGGAIRFDTSASNTDNTLYYASVEGVRTGSNDGSNELRFYTADNDVASGAPQQRMVISEIGDVGIGTGSPSANGTKTTVHINDDSVGAALRLSQGSNSSLIRYSDSDGMEIGTIASKTLKLETNDTTAITIGTDQKVTLADELVLANSQGFYLSGTADGVTTTASKLHRAGGNATRFEYFDNAFVFDSKENKPWEIRNENDTPIFKVTISGGTSDANIANSVTSVTNGDLTIVNGALNVGGTERINNAGDITSRDLTQTRTDGYLEARGDLKHRKDIQVMNSAGNGWVTWLDRNSGTPNLQNLNDITMGGTLKGPATFTIDPATHGDNTGTVVIAGNLQVDGSTTTINSTELTIDDKTITLASGSANKSAANGAGIIVDCGSDTDAEFTYTGSNEQFNMNTELNIQPRHTGGTPPSLYLGDLTNQYQSGMLSSGHLTLRATSNFYLQTGGTNYRIRALSDGKFGIGGSGDPKTTFQVEEYGIDTESTTLNNDTQTAIHTIDKTDFRSSRFTVQVTNTTDSTYMITEILMIHDGTTPSITEYGTIFTGSAREATFDCDISGDNVRLLATAPSSNTDSLTFKVVSHSITV